MWPALLALLLSAAPADTCQDPLVELHTALGALSAKDPVRARVAHHLEQRRGEGKDATLTKTDVEGQVAASPDGLQITWGPGLLERLLREEKRRNADPEAPSPTRDALAELDATDLARRVDAAAQLRLVLEQSKLVEVRTEPLDGAPRTVLVLQIEPSLSARDRKYVKKLEATARIWLGADGLPLAAERRVTVSGRAMLVITFESSELERYRFSRAGDRLLTVRHEVERQSEGAGEKSARSSVTTLEPTR
jgi:hypothetical protein